MTTAAPVHPENLASDDVDAILKSLGGEPDESAAEADHSDEDAEEEGASSGVQSGEAASKEVDAEKSEEQNEQEQKTVPLSALFAERDKARRAREYAAQLEAKLAQAEKGATTETPEEQDLMSEQDLAELEEDLPHLAKGMKAIQAKLDKIEAENRELRAREEGRERVAKEDEQAEAATVVQEAIAATPKLAQLEKTLTPEAWDARVYTIDASLREDPEFSKLSMADRFAKVVEIYEYRYGPVSAPATSASTPEKTIEQIAAEKLKEAPNKAAPTTLSDMPGGVPPSSAGHEIQNMSMQQMEKKLMSMSKDQIDAWLNSLA